MGFCVIFADTRETQSCDPKKNIPSGGTPTDLNSTQRRLRVLLDSQDLKFCLIREQKSWALEMDTPLPQGSVFPLQRS